MREGCSPLGSVLIFKGEEMLKLSDGTRVFAVRRQVELERRVWEVQEREKLLGLTQESLLSTDSQLSACISGRIILTPPELQTIKAELQIHEINLVEVQKNEDLSRRVHFQIDVTRRLFQEVLVKFQLLQKPGSFEQRLQECERTLAEVQLEMQTCILCSAKQDIVQSQLKQCMNCYQILNEAKAEVKNVLMLGRQIAENPKDLQSRLTALKLLYNELGAQVTAEKKELEHYMALSQKLNEEVASLTEWLVITDAELTDRCNVKDMPSNLDSELVWAKVIQKETENRQKQLLGALVIAADLKVLFYGKNCAVEDRVFLLTCNWKTVMSHFREWLHLLLDKTSLRKTTLAISPQWYQYHRQNDDLLQWVDDIERSFMDLLASQWSRSKGPTARTSCG